MQFDILSEFYPSVSKKLLLKSMTYKNILVNISD